MRNYDAIQFINPPIFKIILMFFSWSPNFNSLHYPYHPLGPGFRSREPAIKIDGSETLRHPVDILLLELMNAYIF